jgi:hypothetical protein
MFKHIKGKKKSKPMHPDKKEKPEQGFWIDPCSRNLTNLGETQKTIDK